MSRSEGRRERVLQLLPALLLLAAVVAVPILRIVQLSLFRVELDGGLVTRWAGLDQFLRLWQDGRWWTALGNTAVFTASSVGLELVLGVAFALLLHPRFRIRGVVRALVLLPWALPTAVMSLAWAWIFNDSFGVVNDLLGRLGLVRGPVAWLGEPATAMLWVVVADVWKNTPFVTLIVLAGLQGIPEQVLEAARVDGLGAWARFRRVVLPLLAPSLLVAVAFRTVQAYGAFDLPYAMTGGGPGGATETVSLYAYRNYFRYLDFGYGSVGHLRLLSSLGADVVGVEVDPLLRLLYGRPEDQGLIPGHAGAPAGRLTLLHGQFPAGSAVKEAVGSGYDLVISKNVLKNGYIHPAEPVDPSRLVHLGVDRDLGSLRRGRDLGGAQAPALLGGARRAHLSGLHRGSVQQRRGAGGGRSRHPDLLHRVHVGPVPGRRRHPPDAVRPAVRLGRPDPPRG